MGVEIIVMVIVSRGGSQSKWFLKNRELNIFLVGAMWKYWWKSLRDMSVLWRDLVF